MICIVCGEKGSGKTKKMIELANEAIKVAKGQIVFVDVKSKYIYNLHRDIRFVNISEFSIRGKERFFGFINGLIAENYDIDEIYVDNFFDITNSDMHDLELIFNDLKKIGEEYQVNFIFSTNCNKQDIPEFVKDFKIIHT